MTHRQTENEFSSFCVFKKTEDDTHKYNSDDGISNMVSNQRCDKSLTVLNTQGRNLFRMLKILNSEEQDGEKMRG